MTYTTTEACAQLLWGVPLSNVESDLDAFTTYVQERRRCSAVKIVQAIEAKEGPETAAKTKAIINDCMYSAERLSVLLRKNGYGIAKATITAHRQGQCPCK